MRLTLSICIGLALVCAVWLYVSWYDIQFFAATQQRDFQNAMAVALRQVQTGNPFAVWSLCTATAAYGFFHALGPGHGKILIGGAAIASTTTLKRLSIITILSSLAQAATAICLVGGFVLLFKVSSATLKTVTEVWLIPASYAMIASIGGILIFRGIRSFNNIRQKKHAHRCCSGHSHGPNIDDVSTLNSTRDAVALIVSIAMRPCTGALFVLAISARFDAFYIGCLSVITMGLGTAAFNLTVATSGLAARKLTIFSTDSQAGLQTISATLHIIGGTLIVLLSLGMMAPYFS